MRRRAWLTLAGTGALVACGVFTAAATMQGQKKGFACDPDNGGLKLPAGFCAGVIAENLGVARNLVVAPNGDIFMSVRSGPPVQGQPPQPGYLLGLRDSDGDGKIDKQEKFGTQGATGIDLTVSKHSNHEADFVATRGTLTYTIKVSNLGTQDSTNIHVRDALPAAAACRWRSCRGSRRCPHPQTAERLPAVPSSSRCTAWDCATR